MVGTEALTVMGKPDTNLLIFRDGKNEIAIKIVSVEIREVSEGEITFMAQGRLPNLSERTLMPSEQNRPHVRQQLLSVHRAKENDGSVVRVVFPLNLSDEVGGASKIWSDCAFRWGLTFRSWLFPG